MEGNCFILIFLIWMLTGSFCKSSFCHTLPLYQTTKHFKVFCFDINHIDADEIIKQQEQFFSQLEQDFNYKSDIKINVYVCPNLTFLHNIINDSFAPDWVIGFSDKNNHMVVAPSNPGPVHSKKSVLQSCKVGLAELFITDKYNNHMNIPRWLHQGIALYKANFFSLEKLKISFQGYTDFPTIEQLDSVEKADNQLFYQINGFKVSTLLVHFIDIQWGWTILLNLLDNYDNFDSIVGLSKEQFRNQWIKFLNQK